MDYFLTADMCVITGLLGYIASKVARRGGVEAPVTAPERAAPAAPRPLDSYPPPSPQVDIVRQVGTEWHKVRTEYLDHPDIHAALLDPKLAILHPDGHLQITPEAE